jgi:hypothetical protein
MGSPAARVVLALAVVASLAACSDADQRGNDAGATVPGTTTSRAAQAPTDAFPEILNFSAPRLGGGTIEGADYRGQDLALWFWAPW